jgi:hypothetical protein
MRRQNWAFENEMDIPASPFKPTLDAAFSVFLRLPLWYL